MSWTAAVLTCFATGFLAAPARAQVALPQPTAEEQALAGLRDGLQEPTAKGRRQVAKKLAKMKGLDLAAWQGLIAAVEPEREFGPGVHRVMAQLELDGRLEETELVLFVPEAYDPAVPAPLLLLLHGSAGDGAGMVATWRGFAAERGFLLLAPTDPESTKGYAFTPRERAEALEALRWMRGRFRVDPDRVHLHGVSRGGHMAWDLALRRPDLFATVSPAIGGPTWTVSRGRNNLRLVENLATVPVRQLQGMQDDPPLIANLRAAFRRLRAAVNDDAKMIEFPELGHAFRLDGIDWAAFLPPRRRSASPELLRYRTAVGVEHRVHWLAATKLTKEAEEVFPIRVEPRQWAEMDTQARADLIQEMADQHTAEVVATRLPDGSLRVDTTFVSRLELHLPAAWIPADGKLTVVLDGEDKVHRLKPSVRTLLEDFLERGDPATAPAVILSLRP
ncbi:MAG: alpha/beta hydrolase-fold protein [Planctomycetota bacterium]